MKAPPKSSKHVLIDNVRNFNELDEEMEGDGEREGDKLMDMLMGIDFSNNTKPSPKDNDDLIQLR